MNKPRRLVSVLALLAAFMLLFSVLYIALEADHDCCGEGCAVCAQLRACEELLRSLLPAAAFAAALFVLFAPVRVLAGTDRRPAQPHTLIALKVKLSD